LVEGTPRDFFLVDQIELILANLLESELLGRFVEELAELIDVVRVGIDGAWGQVAQLHILGHASDVRIESSVVRGHG
jgi:hypothetical protein